MIALWTALCFAQSAELDEAAPEAREQLETCADQGCRRVEGARAAWIVALHTYVNEGVADPRLSATVRELDYNLFTELPDVVRDAATEPLEWSLNVGPEYEFPEEGYVEGELVRPVTITTPSRKAGAALIVEVLDTDGRVVPHAHVRFPDEGDLHTVNIYSGRWTGSVRYRRDGTEGVFDKGDSVQIEVIAAGYRYHREVVAIEKRRKQLHRVRLSEWQPTLPADAPEAANHAVKWFHDWGVAEAGYVVDPSEQAALEVYDTRRRGADAARTWLDQSNSSLAWELCIQMGTNLQCGPSPSP